MGLRATVTGDRLTEGLKLWSREQLPCGSAGNASARNAGDLALIAGLGRSPGEGKGCLPTPVFWPGDFRGLDGVAKSRTRLSDLHFTSGGSSSTQGHRTEPMLGKELQVGGVGVKG